MNDFSALTEFRGARKSAFRFFAGGENFLFRGGFMNKLKNAFEDFLKLLWTPFAASYCSERCCSLLELLMLEDFLINRCQLRMGSIHKQGAEFNFNKLISKSRLENVLGIWEFTAWHSEWKYSAYSSCNLRSLSAFSWRLWRIICVCLQCDEKLWILSNSFFISTSVLHNECSIGCTVVPFFNQRAETESEIFRGAVMPCFEVFCFANRESA